MKPKHKITNLGRFILYIDDIYWVSSSDYCLSVFNLVSGNNQKISQLDIGHFFDIILLNDCFFLSFSNKIAIFSIKENKWVKELKSDHFLARFKSNDFLYGLNDKTCAKVSKDNIEPINVQTIGLIIYADKNKIVSNNENTISCLTYEGKLVWERDLKEVGRFYQNFLSEGWQDGCIKNVQIFEELLIVSLYGHKLLALSIATGETIWEQKLKGAYIYMTIDYSERIVYALCGAKYKINAKTGEILFTNPESKWQGQPFNEGLVQPTVAKDAIYAPMAVSKPAKIIKYSKETLDVLKVIELDNEAIIPTNYSPTVTDKYLMQLDGEDSLHIFELKDL